MSYKSREKKRRAKINAASSSKDLRLNRIATGSRREARADRHYITIVSRACCCNRCGGSLRDGAECVFRHTPKQILCVTCADLQRISYRPSLRWERRNRKLKHGKLVPSPRQA